MKFSFPSTLISYTSRRPTGVTFDTRSNPTYWLTSARPTAWRPFPLIRPAPYLLVRALKLHSKLQNVVESEWPEGVSRDRIRESRFVTFSPTEMASALMPSSNPRFGVSKTIHPGLLNRLFPRRRNPSASQYPSMKASFCDSGNPKTHLGTRFCRADLCSSSLSKRRANFFDETPN